MTGIESGGWLIALQMIFYNEEPNCVRNLSDKYCESVIVSSKEHDNCHVGSCYRHVTVLQQT